MDGHCVINLSKFKDHKKYKLISEDLHGILKIINLSINALHPYRKYKPVMEVISNLQNNKTLLELHDKKINKLLEDYKND